MPTRSCATVRRVGGLVVPGGITPLAVDVETERRGRTERSSGDVGRRVALVRQDRLALGALMGDQVRRRGGRLGVPPERRGVALGVEGGKDWVRRIAEDEAKR